MCGVWKGGFVSNTLNRRNACKHDTKMLRLPNIEGGLPVSKALLRTTLVVSAQGQMTVITGMDGTEQS